MSWSSIPQLRLVSLLSFKFREVKAGTRTFLLNMSCVGRQLSAGTDNVERTSQG